MADHRSARAWDLRRTSPDPTLQFNVWHQGATSAGRRQIPCFPGSGVSEERRHWLAGADRNLVSCRWVRFYQAGSKSLAAGKGLLYDIFYFLTTTEANINKMTMHERVRETFWHCFISQTPRVSLVFPREDKVVLMTRICDTTGFTFDTVTMMNNLRKTVCRPPPPPPLSTEYSTPGVQNSFWCSQDFMLGAGMVLIQENTHKIVVIYETRKKYWFFPRGRKDIGESLEHTALREAYEEVCMVFLYRFCLWIEYPDERRLGGSLVIVPSSCLSLALIMPPHHQTTIMPMNVRILNQFSCLWHLGSRNDVDLG